MHQSWLILLCCYFCWIKRDADSIVHELSKNVLYSNISYFCKCVSLSLAVMEASESNVDIPSFCSFNEIFTFIHTHTQKKRKKKKKKSGLQSPIMHGSRKEINLDNGGKRPSITSPSCQWFFFFFWLHYKTAKRKYQLAPDWTFWRQPNTVREKPISTWLNILMATQPKQYERAFTIK